MLPEMLMQKEPFKINWTVLISLIFLLVGGVGVYLFHSRNNIARMKIEVMRDLEQKKISQKYELEMNRQQAVEKCEGVALENHKREWKSACDKYADQWMEILRGCVLLPFDGKKIPKNKSQELVERAIEMCKKQYPPREKEMCELPARFSDEINIKLKEEKLLCYKKFQIK